MNDSMRANLERGQRNQKVNKKFLIKIKRMSDKKLDPLFHEEHDKAFEQIDCLECGNCCKTTSPIFRDRDIDRLAKHFRIKSAKLVEDHLHLDRDGDYVLNSSPCTFLNEDNTCSVYDVRPNACREYPHTDRKKMSQVLDLTFQNTLVCPAVEQIVEKIKNKLEIER
ncbi:MAG: YkgJ family cysteine cluster protein [Flavobacteriales bacterium]|nr:YkgJ family cysteine cluster protein [Flavobacteriales bacterium]MDG1781265.1 YkgJ family cysteine cluster protein [Flavobacteriales bacterium]